MAISKLKLILLLLIPSFAPAQSLASKAADLAGIYEMALVIGEKTFHDTLIIESTQPMPIDTYSGELQGSITVPNVFSAPLQGNANCLLFRLSKCTLNFEILADENGHQFKVFYKAELKGYNYYDSLFNGGAPILIGEAALENGELLGRFTAKKVNLN